MHTNAKEIKNFYFQIEKIRIVLGNIQIMFISSFTLNWRFFSKIDFLPFLCSEDNAAQTWKLWYSEVKSFITWAAFTLLHKKGKKSIWNQRQINVKLVTISCCFKKGIKALGLANCWLHRCFLPNFLRRRVGPDDASSSFFCNFETSSLNGIRQGAIRLEACAPRASSLIVILHVTAHSSIQLMCGNGVSKMSFSSLPPCHLSLGGSTSKSVPNLPLASNLVNRIGNNQKGFLKPSIIKQRHSANKLIRRVESKVKIKEFFPRWFRWQNWIFLQKLQFFLDSVFFNEKWLTKKKLLQF